MGNWRHLRRLCGRVAFVLPLMLWLRLLCSIAEVWS